MSDSQNTVNIQHAHKYYNKRRNNEIHVMNDVDIALPSVGMVAVFGQSGCGKTTLLNAIGGLDRINSGSISIFGNDLSKNTDIIRNQFIGFIFQNYNLNVTETVLENVGDSLRLCGMKDEEEIRTRALYALKNVEMDKYKDRLPDTLSGGQQQRVAIARAIVKRPAIILADEPTGNLDENNTVKVMDILKEISRTCLVILVTHEANLVDFYCDRVIEMSDGKIVNTRDNTNTHGYIQRNKNDIWLGELEKKEQQVDGVDLTWYGTIPSDTPIKLRLICENGKLYVKCDSPNVRLLDDSAEINLREGVFKACPSEEQVNHESAHVDMSGLQPVQGTVYGQLYHFSNSLKLAWRESFSAKKQKGKKFLSFCLAVLAFVMVFMTASFSTGIRDYRSVLKKTEANLFYLPILVSDDGSFQYDYNRTVRDMIGQNGIMSSYCTYNNYNLSEYLDFKTASFMTAQGPTISVQPLLMPLSSADGLKLLSGTCDKEDKSNVLISKGMADDILENCTVSYIKSYDDLIGLVSEQSLFDDPVSNLQGRIRISGVVDSDEHNILYINDYCLTERILNYTLGFNNALYAASSYTKYQKEIAHGEAVLLIPSNRTDLYQKESTVTILGTDFAVADTVILYTDVNEYPLYYEQQNGRAPLSFREYLTDVKSLNAADSDDTRQAFWEWLMEYYPSQLKSFVKDSIVSDCSMALWLYAEKNSVASYVQFLSESYEAIGLSTEDLFLLSENPDYGIFNDAWLAWEYKQSNGCYPTVSELHSMVTQFDYTYYYKKDVEQYERKYWNAKDISFVYDSNIKYAVVLSDEDYLSVGSGAGHTNSELSYTDEYFENMYYEYRQYRDNNQSQNARMALLIHSSDVDATEAYLASIYGENFYTPSDIRDNALSTVWGEILEAIISVSIVVALMCLCIFFIMRSSFMSRVREVGIQRAIGVTKRNLVYRFCIESILLTMLSVDLGFIIAWLIENYVSSGVILSDMFYFPVWLAVPEMIIINVLCVLFGILPAVLLLRKTPSEILSKYDI